MVSTKEYVRYKVHWDVKKQQYTANAKISKRNSTLPSNLKSCFRRDDINDLEFDIKVHYKMQALYKRKGEWVFT